jgi:hypothetical protein
MDLPDRILSRAGRALVVRSRRRQPAGPGRATASQPTCSNPFRQHSVEGRVKPSKPSSDNGQSVFQICRLEMI